MKKISFFSDVLEKTKYPGALPGYFVL